MKMEYFDLEIVILVDIWRFKESKSRSIAFLSFALCKFP